MLQSQDFRVGQGKETCIGLTQENSIENSCTGLSILYTKTPMVYTTTTLAYPK